MKREAISIALRAEVMERHADCCAICGLNVRRLDIGMRNMPSSWDRMHNGRPVYGKRSRYTAASPQGALLGRHRDRAHALLGRWWGIALKPGCHFFEIDHIKAVADGGRSVASNLRLLCRRCHKGESVALNGRLRSRPTKGVGRGFNR